MNPTTDDSADLYRGEYVKSFVEKWDELIDWQGRAQSEGQFFIDILRARGKQTVLDVACGTGYHSVRLTKAGFNVTSADGSAAMLSKAFTNAQSQGLILKTVQADWRWLNREIQGKYDAIICLGNSFTHLFDEKDRRRALAEFYAALKHDGILILDQRNYDAMLDHGYSSKHKYYYCGDRVTAEPDHVAEDLVRFKYSFDGGEDYWLNFFPFRKNYVRRILSEAGFARVRTYGDFQDTYAEDDPDFFIHVAEKSAMHVARWTGAGETASEEPDVAEGYYDSDSAEAFYSTVWGGQDLHIGCYEETSDIRAASQETVERMAAKLPETSAESRILDIGAGYGGAMRTLVGRNQVGRATCLNISDVQNDVNRHRNRLQGFTDRINVVHGTFENIPDPDASYDVVWSMDAILHSAHRTRVLEEVWRVLRRGGLFVFTDPCEADEVPEGVLQPVYNRIQLSSLPSFRFYRETCEALGFETVGQEDLTHNLRSHYARVREDMLANYDKLLETGASKEYLDAMSTGLQTWVEAADAGHLAWGIQMFRKPR